VKRLRILHVADIRGIGGLQTWVRGLAAAQARMAHEVHIMLPPWAYGLTREECFTELPIHRWNPDAISKFDVVHTHGLAGFLNLHWRKISNRPAIVHTYYGTILGIQIAMRWYQNLIGWNGLAVPKSIWMDARCGWGADHVIAVSWKVGREIKYFYRIIEQRITVIPGGYTPLHYNYNLSKQEVRRLLGLPEMDFLWLFVGRPDPVKAFDLVLSAFRKIGSQSQHCRLVVAPREHPFSDDNVLGLLLPPERMPLLYQACDAFINASIYDAYSLAVHEALAYGLPAIISQGAGNAEYCRPGIDAIVTRPSKKIFVETMTLLMSSPALRSRLSENAKRLFGPRTWDWVAEQVEEVYKKIQRLVTLQ
jgi:glycosyltransferase involved in cell wall biosynthesis